VHIPKGSADDRDSLRDEFRVEGEIPMLLLALGVATGLLLTAVVVAKVASASGASAPDLGSMSDQWLASYNASRHAPSL
jgi:hypothetical protein